MRTGPFTLTLLSSIVLCACGGGGGGGGNGGAVTFVHTTGAFNAFGNYTLIAHPSLDLNSDAIVLVTHAVNPGGALPTDHPHHVAVGYDPIAGKWALYNEDGAAMAFDRSFHVCVPEPGPEAFVVVASSANVTLDDYVVRLYEDHPELAGDPTLRLLVTQARDPDGPAVFNDHVVGLWYDGIGWTVFNEDGAAMPLGTVFHLWVAPASETFVHTAGLIKGDTTWLDHPRLNGDPFAMPLVAQSYDPGAVYNTSPVSVVYVSEIARWGVRNADAPTMPSGVSFVVRVR
jgi:hypothetical protein